jgi:hypothetical protein
VTMVTRRRLAAAHDGRTAEATLRATLGRDPDALEAGFWKDVTGRETTYAIR